MPQRIPLDHNQPAGLRMKTLRVLVVAPGNMLGGQAHAARDIVHGFAQDTRIHAELLPIDPRLPGRFAFLTEWKLVRSLVRTLLYVRSLLRGSRDAHVLHVFCAAHTAFLFGALPALAVGRLRNCPVLLNYHDGRAEAHFRWWGPVLRWALRRASLLVFPSTYLQELFRRKGFDGIVVPNVVDTAAFAYKAPAPVRCRMLSARLLEPLYDVSNTLAAFALVRAEIPNAECDIYGDGVSRPALEKLARKLGDKGITFHGAIAHAQMPGAFAEGGILVNSSWIDNTPHVLIEAFASGLPIVTTASGGIAHMVKHEATALLVPTKDPQALAAAVLRVVREPGLATRLADAGLKECRRYTWSAAQDGWLQAYRRAVRVPHSRALDSAGMQLEAGD